jgi:hypothetical protein
VFAQQNTLTYQLDMQDPIPVPVVLSGPDPSCLSVPLLLNVTYEPVEKMITVEVKYDNDKNAQYVKLPKKKDQITHLWFPLSWNDVQYKFMGYKRYFQDNFSSKVVQEPPMREQIANSGSSDLIRPAFQFINGELQNPMNEDIMLTVQGGRKIVMKIKVSDLDKPVVMTINNVIPLRAKYEYSMESNKFFLKYISNSCSITFNLPEDDCAKLYEYIEQYKQWNKELNDELSAMFKLDPQKDKTEIIRRKLLMYYNYKDVRRNLRETKCDKLRQEFDAFRRNYDDYISKGLITIDSLEKIFEELDDLYDEANRENNYGHGKKCNELKQKAAKFNVLGLDESAYMDFSEAFDMVLMIKDRINVINGLPCRGGGGSSVVVETQTHTPRVSRCNVDIEKIRKATDEINTMVSKYRTEKKKDERAYTRIVKDADDYLQSLSESCKNDNKYKNFIEDYQKAKNLYEKRVK